MPTIVDYNTLVTSVADFTHRSDLATFVDYFIQAAQELINNDIFERNEGNGIRPMEATLTPVVITNGVVPVPADWLSPKTFQIVTGGGQIFTLNFKDPQWIYNVYPVRQGSGLPAYIAREGSNFIFGPYPDSAYTVQGSYYQLAPLLSGSQATNWMVLQAPHMLHAAVMKQAAKFIKDPEMLQTWEAIYQDRIEKLVDRDKSERWASATMQVEIG